MTCDENVGREVEEKKNERIMRNYVTQHTATDTEKTLNRVKVFPPSFPFFLKSSNLPPYPSENAQTDTHSDTVRRSKDGGRSSKNAASYLRQTPYIVPMAVRGQTLYDT
ncbi:hypothetical protein, unlikely [Trypanosoma brucei gambiense DAL972]|uniref:Uncharacterized protein n=1 Tax=Trypanosoma brucei gambiense (strain MHOM/CI/86/DAL972) TaxID=679716 RepID=D0A591_TRYB9|nr:hypothetical protein, unlikely [Trypanosoma brucei gambiense DAL972]CBH16435.1 hypothetical protein, unlikely [Trypanosoma brucei gambiense DAL972]|eukprot:XP_011778699.1 hypothetical protein, unlikely [Trypanosoma brucei gambiense DAL972]